MTSKRSAIAVVAVSATALLTGCADKLTREHFDMISIGHAEAYDVEQTIGEPSDTMPDMWHYERVDKHLNVMVHYGDGGKVNRKEWHDTLNGIHYDSEEAPGDSNTYESTRVRTIDD